MQSLVWGLEKGGLEVYKIVEKEILAPNMFSMDILAPRIARAAQAGQFVIVITDDKGERIPLTICDLNQDKGTVNIVVQSVGYSTECMAKYEVGESFKDFVGPLGKPSDFLNLDLAELKKKRYLFVAGGVGIAPIYPQVKWFHQMGLEADVIMGARTKELLILEDKLAQVAKNLYVCTDDGSYGFKGLVTDKIYDLVKNKGQKYDQVVTIGPMIMMKFVCQMTKKLEIPTIVSLNTIMVDGTGMCGACRVTVGEETKFACVDGPEFDGHLVDFDEAIRRQAQYASEEKQMANEGCSCGGGGH